MRVLVVDDEMEFVSHVKRGLEREGFAVDIAYDGDEGVWLASNQHYDAVVLDVMLPGRNGFQVCSDLRGASNWVPILMLTAKDGEYDEAEALDTGADDFLRKPFSFVVLLARLRALLRRGGAERPPVIEVGDLRLDPAARSLQVAGGPVSLTATEFRVLHFLLARAGQVQSKAEILDACWDWAFDGDPNIVEVYVRYLRRKIGVDRIRTVRGAGYVIDP